MAGVTAAAAPALAAAMFVLGCARPGDANELVPERSVETAAILAAAVLYMLEAMVVFLVWPMVANARRQGRLITRTLRMRAVWRARQALRISEARQREVGQVAATFSHDINNVFGAILSAADAADELSAQPALREVTASIVSAVGQGMLSSQRMLAFGDMLPLRPFAGDVNETVVEAARQVNSTTEAVVVKLAGRPLVAVLDHDRLLACVLELLRNARNVNGPAARITIQTRLVSADAESAHALHAAIEVVDSTPESPPRDTALHLVERFARGCGGTLDRRSRPGEGTSSVLTLPLSPAPGVTASQGRMIEQTRGEKRVLVVDDNAPLRAGMARRLRLAGFAVSEAADAAEAIATTSLAIDAIITDVVLPGDMDGFALGRHFRGIDPNLALVFVSGFISSRQPEVLANDDLANFLRKPVDFENLIAVLLGLLAIRETRMPRGKVRAG